MVQPTKMTTCAVPTYAPQTSKEWGRWAARVKWCLSFFLSFLGVNSALDFCFCFGWLEWPGTVSWILRAWDLLNAYHPLSPVIKLGICHLRMKERKGKESAAVVPQDAESQGSDSICALDYFSPSVTNFTFPSRPCSALRHSELIEYYVW